MADSSDRFLGAAFGRLFGADAAGYGYVAPDVPEVAIGVEPELRAAGVGSALLAALERDALDAGHTELSLSVSAANPALRWYRRLGWVTHHETGDSVVMVRRLRP